MAMYKHYMIVEGDYHDVYVDPRNYTVSAVTEFYVVNNVIQSGYDSQLPKSIVDMMFKGSSFQYYTTLYPGQDVRWYEVFQTYDRCGADFEIGIPVGAIAAVYIIAYGGTALGPAAYTAAALFSSIGVSISAQGSSITIFGGVGNMPQSVPVDLSILTSNLRYSQGGCTYNVPIVIYVNAS